MLSKIARPLCFGAAVAVSAALAQAVPFDITNPGDAVTPSSANSPGGEPSPNVIDNRYDTKYLNFDKLNTGFTVTPSANGQVIHGMTITSANDAPERDPASYILSGSNDGVNFTQIATGNLSPFAARRTQQDVPFDNSAAYQQYRLIFPTVLNAGAANSMQVGEVQLLTHMDITGLGDSIRGSSTNTPAGEQPRGALDNRYDSKYLNFDKLGTGLTVVPGRGVSVVHGLSVTTANDSPDRDPVNYELYGSNDNVNFSLIASGALSPSTDRYSQQEYAITNSAQYAAYRMVFPDVRDANTANSMQVGEIQLLGDITRPTVTRNLNFGRVFNADVIVNNGNGLDGTQNGIDGGNRNYLTQSAATQIGGSNGNGLPDDGLFTTSHRLGMDVQLGYNNNDDGNNAIRLLNGQGVQFDLDPADQGQYASLFLFATNGDGDGQLSVNLRYADGSMDNRQLTVDDWFNDGGELAPGVEYLIDGLDRTNGGGNGFEDNTDPAIFALDLTPDITKMLLGLDLASTGGGVTSIFGATGQQYGSSVPEPVSAVLGLMSLGALAAGTRRRRIA